MPAAVGARGADAAVVAAGAGRGQFVVAGDVAFDAAAGGAAAADPGAVLDATAGALFRGGGRDFFAFGRFGRGRGRNLGRVLRRFAVGVFGVDQAIAVVVEPVGAGGGL